MKHVNFPHLSFAARCFAVGLVDRVLDFVVGWMVKADPTPEALKSANTRNRLRLGILMSQALVIVGMFVLLGSQAAPISRFVGRVPQALPVFVYLLLFVICGALLWAAMIGAGRMATRGREILAGERQSVISKLRSLAAAD